ncbi:hypothetical protein LSH36_57g08055 [Paralvinella palmiformis]|uniref:Farnesyl pyrophosphate synthase n=1 Tax=Paralvinella palmiformis TaxID=53620 RepID=A0AAD9K5K3_9ANNE|nr:hypothetical protein LSH36_57g08055 [Paralvinella palmiformis]
MMTSCLANRYGFFICRNLNSCYSWLRLAGHDTKEALATYHAPGRLLTTTGDQRHSIERKTSSSRDQAYFDQIFPELVNGLLTNGLHYAELQEANQWFKKVCEYNVPCGKKIRGLTVQHSYKCLVNKPNQDNLHLAGILGWCVEWFQSFLLVADDIMDNSITRRGKSCWYRREGVGLKAINDLLYLENTIYVILKKYFSTKPYYVDLMELFHETALQTITGQCLDLNTTPSGRLDFTYFTLDRYHTIVKWKTAYYSFCLPVALAMYMAEITDTKTHGNAREILLRMGTYFQVQDDYLDCFSDPELTGKIGTDIEDNKCSWLVVQALAKCNDEQRKDNYGQNDSAKVSKVKDLYIELGLPDLYQQYEDESYKQLMELIDKLSGSLPKEMFVAYMNRIFRRQR